MVSKLLFLINTSGVPTVCKVWAFVCTGMNRPLGLFYQSGPEFSEDVWTKKIMRETVELLNEFFLP